MSPQELMHASHVTDASRLSMLLVSIVAGMVTINIIFLISAIVSCKAFKFRYSFASLIASMFFGWVAFALSAGLMAYLFPTQLLGAVVLVIALIGFLTAFWMMQPLTISQMIERQQCINEKVKGKELRKLTRK